MLGKVNKSESVVEYLPPVTAIPTDTALGYTPMTFNGGPLISAPEFVSLYWGPFSASDISTMQAWLAGFAGYLSGVGAPVAQEQVLVQYGICGATVGAWYHESSAPASATEANVQAKIQSLQAAGHLPGFSAERLFLVFTKNISFSGYATSWCAYHGDWGTGRYFAICPYPQGGCGDSTPLPSWQTATSHEIMEAATDAVPGRGWVEGHEEGGDTCAWQEVSLPFGTVQKFADNLQSTCSTWTTPEVPHLQAVSWGPNRLDVFVRGTNGALFHKWWDGSHWGPSVGGWESLGGNIVGAPEVVSWGSNRLDVFARGTDGAMYHKWWDGSHWGPSVSGWESLGGRIIGAPEAVAWGPNRLDVFVVGTDGALYHKWWDGSHWGPSVSGWEWMGGVIVGAPTAVAWGPNRLDVFVRGTDDAMYHKWWDGSHWGPSVSGSFERLGGVLTTDPVPVSWSANRLDVFCRGSDGALYHKWWDGSHWGPSVGNWEGLGGQIIGPPGAVAWGPHRLDVFARGTDGAMYHKWWDGSHWGPSVSGWEGLGGILVGSPVPVSWSANRLDIFVEGTDAAMYHKWWDGSHWGPSVSTWERLGGVLG